MSRCQDGAHLEPRAWDMWEDKEGAEPRGRRPPSSRDAEQGRLREEAGDCVHFLWLL